MALCAQAHIHADVVEKRGRLQEQPLAILEAVLIAELVEETRGQHRHVLSMSLIEAEPPPQ